MDENTITKGRPARRSYTEPRPEPPSTSPKLSASGGSPSQSGLVIRSFNRKSMLNASSSGSFMDPKGNEYPADQSPSQSSKPKKKESTKTNKRAKLIKNAKPPRLNNSTTSWASFDDDDDDDDGNIIYQSSLQTPKPNKESTKITIRVKPPTLNSWASFDDDDTIGSDVEKPEHTASTKIVSQRMASHSDHRTENPNLQNLLKKLRDPAELERMKAERERLSQKTPSAFKNNTLQTSLHDKVTEQNSSRNLKTFLQRPKRGYGQQSNLDGLSVIQ